MAATKAAPKKRSQFEEVWRRLKKNKMAMIGLAIVVFLVLLAVFADFLFDYEQVVIKQNTAIRLQGPSAEHWFGTDEFGRDILARLVHGGRISLVVGVIAVAIALVLGGTLGAISGFFGGKVDMLISRAMDILLAVPSLLLSITIVSALGPSIINLMIAIAVSSVPGYARIVRSSVMTVRDNEFVEAAKAIGANDAQIIASHILPNCLAPIIVQVSLKVASAILSTSGLSFLGLGVKAPTPEWGSMLSGGRAYLRNAPHLTVFPGLCIMLTILSMNLLGDGLRDALDPKLKQ
ncbi:MAG: ABC transporter permease [Lachnospiraceae bacterium]|nr:ABC transporter permease [Lachnospiraceae bacterium]MBQ2023264.1 ABC transporter permease [Lachnospiraceae bacterium]MBQ2106545.1 ABC transporter permease [Lachnospiraceae bacterium]MBQ2403928.1 ABC transporter permease [Lachnospiraceae bacterium]MBQ2425469.1 ABC transporter permease [Lachnospiraceae bacterium]